MDLASHVQLLDMAVLEDIFKWNLLLNLTLILWQKFDSQRGHDAWHILSTICNLKKCMNEQNTSSVNSKGHAFKLRMDKKASELSVGRAICDWKMYKQIQRQMVLRGKKKEAPNRITTIQIAFSTNSDPLHRLCLAFLLKQPILIIDIKAFVMVTFLKSFIYIKLLLGWWTWFINSYAKKGFNFNVMKKRSIMSHKTDTY